MLISIKKTLFMLFVGAIGLFPTYGLQAAESSSPKMELENYYNKHYSQEGACVLVSKNNTIIRIVYSPKLDITVFRDGENINSVTSDGKIQNIRGMPVSEQEKGYILQMVPVIKDMCKK